MSSRLPFGRLTAAHLLGMLLATLAALAVASTLWTQVAAATSAVEEPASWRFAPAAAPPPAPGTPEAEFPVRLGQVGDISFWQPNRGLLITGGTGRSCAESAGAVVPCGLYEYNGESWYLLSTVCGGANGRIAWAGPDEFWTISDQRPGQVVTAGAEYGNVSLCHFLNGQVVGSYAMPLNQPDSYLPMDAAGCIGPNDCWFGGELGLPPNNGAFHLHWNGQTVSVVYSPEDHAVVSMALAKAGVIEGGPAELFESVQLEPTDNYGFEDPEHPAVLHRLDPPGSSVAFHNVFIPRLGCAELEPCPPLPNYGIDEEEKPVAPDTLGGFMLSSDYTLSGATPEPFQLWAIAGPNGNEPENSSEGTAHTIALRYSQGIWTQVLGGEGPGGKAPGGSEPLESEAAPTGVAAEPGSAAAWVTIRSSDGEAHVARLTAAGKLSQTDVLGKAQNVGQRGEAGPIACPAANDCWLATNQGWLFHFTTPASTLPLDTDPNFAGVITFRPSDGGVPQLPPNEPPPDDSLANQLPPPPPPTPTTTSATSLEFKALVTDEHTRVIHRYTLELSFKLTVKARVQLLASHGRHQVARTRMETLKAGPHTLRLRLNPHAWPNKLDLKTKALEKLPTVPVKKGASSPSSGQTVAPPVSANTVGT
jgi:hypothetical protein